ncbi:DHA2 family efflux MFS transporter permease subunit [Oceanobacillus saliphilus]|uniref:DHA2 family efflux MFS transporter permease subunit n=1 Tax=Oceanobacillus saliphilus TaxID=2925834 RepID=UPI00201E3F69|nr:DHA2 family efflux MFS transporter permease subunit [Oceanobacillus saliphilus]
MNASTTFNRKAIVGILLAASFVSILNQTLLIIAIPPIMADFQIDANQAQWLTTGFMLTNGILIPITAFLMDKFSSKNLLMAALLFFSAGTFLGAIAPTFSVLLIGRIVQAAGAGIMMPLMQTILMSLYPPEKRGAAMGMAGLVTGFAPAIGPTLSGWIIGQFSWRYLFYIILPIALVILVLSFFIMKNVTEQKEAKIDITSIILSSFGWGGLLYGFSMAGSYGWMNSVVIGSIIVGGVSLYLFIKRQLSLEIPILEFRVFQSKIFVITTILSTLVFAIMVGVQTLLPLYVQNVKGASPLDSGLILLPGALLMGLMSPVTGKFFDKFGGRMLAITGYGLILLSMILFTLLQMDSPLLLLSLFFVIMMLGISMIMMPMTTAGINSLHPRLIGHGTAMNNTIRMVGGSIGTALLISVMSTVSTNVSSGSSSEAMLIGIKVAFAAAAVMALIGFILSFNLKDKNVNGSTGQGSSSVV